VDPQERVERRLDRQSEEGEKKSDRRLSLWVAVLVLVGVALSTGGAYYGAKLGADTTLESQQREFKAEGQKETRELCLELSDELNKTHEALFALDFSSDAGRERFDQRIPGHIARWEGLSNRAVVDAPVPIWSAVNKVWALLLVMQSRTLFGQPIGPAPTFIGDFNRAAFNLRNACRTEQGVEPLPSPSSR
jgi:hypothetical protein